jgi:hypothetical protein
VRKCISLFFALFLLVNSSIKGQNNAPPLPQRGATVSVDQNLDFGDIILERNSNGGNVSITSLGDRTRTGDIYLPNSSFLQPILSFKLCPGRVVNVIYNPMATLTDGIQTLNMSIDEIRIGNTLITSSGGSFISNKGCSDTHYIQIGTTLYVTGSLSSLTNFSGVYNGSFTITLAQQ